MSILILGGAGFVGRHYTEHFLSKGKSVVVIDNIAPLSGGVHPKKWKLFKKSLYNKKNGYLIITYTLSNRYISPSKESAIHKRVLTFKDSIPDTNSPFSNTPS